MGKRIYWFLLIGIALVGVTTMIYFGIQPRPIPKIKLSKFESHTVLANSLLLRLREEIKNSPVIFLGLDPDRPEHFEIWHEFLKQNHESGFSYDVVVREAGLVTDLFPQAEMVSLVEQFSVFEQGIEKALAAGHRVAILMPTTFSVQMIQQNVASRFNAKVQPQATSFSLTDFPRSREDEQNMTHLCVVAAVDQSGLGPFGCTIVQSARANYRKRFETGEQIGFVNQIGLRDYLIFYTKEK
jgi:hypothetical protein